MALCQQHENRLPSQRTLTAHSRAYSTPSQFPAAGWGSRPEDPALSFYTDIVFQETHSEILTGHSEPGRAKLERKETQMGKQEEEKVVCVKEKIGIKLQNDRKLECR